jgi:hypothetical protein
MKERGERGNRKGGLVEKGKGQGVFGQKAIFFLPPLIQNRWERGGTTWPAGRALAGGPCSTAVGK